MIRWILRPAAMCAALALAACQSMTPMTPMPAKAANGTLTEPGGKSLYTFAKDVAGSGRSECNGPCANLWPPFEAGAGATGTGNWTLVKRDDGRMQWAYKGKPLYTFSKDTKPGDTSGDKYNGLWSLATD